MMISRRSMLSTASAGLAALSASRLFAEGPAVQIPAGEFSPSFPQQQPEMVKEMVGVSHGNIARVRELLALRPALAKATYDWGYGDWETAIGAASHVGNHEIAALLIKHGARPDMFTFAMLGQIDVVKAYIAVNPGIQKTLGPHGITLLAHAKAGGERSAAVVKYLVELGDADIGEPSLPLSAESKKLYLGDYGFKSDPDARLMVKTTRTGTMSIQHGAKGTSRQLFRTGDHTFHPAGAPAVEFAFEMKGNAVSALRITDGAVKLVVPRL